MTFDTLEESIKIFRKYVEKNKTPFINASKDQGIYVFNIKEKIPKKDLEILENIGWSYHEDHEGWHAFT